jgi:hypothetical protein
MKFLEKITKKANKINFLIPAIFLGLIISFLFILGQFFIPSVRDFFRGSLLFLSPFLLFSLLGLILFFLIIINKRIKGALKRFLIISGVSAAGIFPSIILHNLIYGLAIIAFGPDFWTNIGLGDEVFFFLLGVIILPIGFLTGTIGAIFLLMKKKSWH